LGKLKEDLRSLGKLEGEFRSSEGFPAKTFGTHKTRLGQNDLGRRRESQISETRPEPAGCRRYE
jgi:hypothetical protein